MKASGDMRPRVLHLIGSLGFGGIETWLVHMLRHQDQFSVRHELLLTKGEAAAHEPEVRALGIPIHRLPLSDGKAGWLRRFHRFLRDQGPFAAVHSHGAPHFAAPALEMAKRAGVPIRIAHSHSARSRSEGKDYPLRLRLARRFGVPWLRRTATRRIGITETAVEEIVGPDWRGDPSASVLIYGFDFDRYQGAAKRAKALRASLGIPADTPLIGNVARFAPVKNHRLLLEGFAECLKALPEARLVLVGEGPLRDEIEAHARSLGIADKVHFAGTSSDVPAFMAMFDLFVLPSFSEGLGIVVVEAQAAGTRALISETTPEEASVVDGAVEVLPLAAGAKAWGQAMARLVRLPSQDTDQWLDAAEQSRFGIRRCIDELDSIYRSELAKTR
jgi:glycosyltransferase involved in cell wall biosynthesis